MFDPSAQEGMGLQLNPLWGEDAEEDEVELEEREAPPAPPVRRRRPAPKKDPGSRLFGGFAAVSVVLVYWCIGVLVLYC